METQPLEMRKGRIELVDRKRESEFMSSAEPQQRREKKNSKKWRSKNLGDLWVRSRDTMSSRPFFI